MGFTSTKLYRNFFANHISVFFVIFTPLMVFNFLTAKGQNAFYDAKRLYQWSIMNDNNPAKKRDVLIIDTILKKYYNENPQLLNENSRLVQMQENIISIGLGNMDDDEIILKLNDRFSKDASQILKNAKPGFETSILTEMNKQRLEITYQQDDIVFFSRMLKRIGLWNKQWPLLMPENRSDSLCSILSVTDSMLVFGQKKVDPVLNAVTLSQFSNDSSNLVAALDTFFTGNNLCYSLVIAKINSGIINSQQKIRQNEEGLLQNFKNLNVTQRKDLVGTTYSPEQLERMSSNRVIMKESLANFNNSSNAEQTSPEVKSAISDQNFPTQSEIIDALAIYMARRFKQEVALTFVENFAKYLKQNQLARDLFPSSLKMIENGDPYALPKLGSEWRNAVSKDLIEMPSNMVASTVITQWLNNDSALYYLSDAVLWANYVINKYSFTDMIRSLYLGNGIAGSGKVLKANWTRKGLLVTYIINEELFDTATSRYWLTPEELARMNNNELEIMSGLIFAKYEKDLNREFGINNFPAGPELIGLKNKFVDFLALLKQFENSQVAAYVSNKQGGSMKDGFWDFQRIFADFLLKQIPEDEASAKERTGVKQVQNIFFVYDYISNKNFGAAINITLEIMDSLLSEKSPTKYLRTFVNKESVSTLEKFSLIPNMSNQTKGYLKELENTARLKYLMAKTPLPVAFEQRLLLNTYSKTFNESLSEGFPANHSAFLKDSLKEVTFEQMDQYLDSHFDYLKGYLNDSLPKTSVPQDFFKDLRFYNLQNTTADVYKTKFQQYVTLADATTGKMPPEIVGSIRKITGFLTDAATAKNSKELSNVMETYAQPPLSYKLTRKSILAIDLTGYVGGWVGIETPRKDINSTDFSNIKGAFGLTVPVGVQISWGSKTHNLSSITKKINHSSGGGKRFFLDKEAKPTYLNNSSNAIFLSIIDILGPFSFRFGNDNASGLPEEVSWSQVLAPGIHFMKGLRNAPICISAGFQFAPKLRSFDAATKDEPLNMMRFQLGIMYEMPLLNFYRKIP